MAKANLNVTPELIQIFAASQNGSIRTLRLTIIDENIVCDGQLAPVADVEADFNSLAGGLVENQPHVFVFCLDPAAAALQWILIAWTPDLSKVRDKMLYASSRDDIKKTLGLNYFVSGKAGDYYANEAADMNWGAYLQSHQSDTSLYLSETEKALKLEANLERDHSVKSTAMGVIPFHFTEPLRQQFQAFSAGSCNWVGMRIDKETVELTGAQTLAAMDPATLEAQVGTVEPEFYAVNYLNKLKVFVYSCPENSPIKLKMVCSTAKATIVGECETLGLVFDKVVMLLFFVRFARCALCLNV
jgi:twinfilin-like protein